MLGKLPNEIMVQNAFCDLSEISERFARELELRFPGNPKTQKESNFRSEQNNSSERIPQEAPIGPGEIPAKASKYWRYQLRSKRNRKGARRAT